MTHSCMWRDWFICVTWRIHMRDMTYSYVRHDSCMRSRACVWYDSFSCLKSLIRVCDVTLHMRDMTYSYVRHDSFMCDVTHSCVMWLIHVWCDSFMCDMTHSCVTWLIHVWYHSLMCDITYSYGTWLIHICHELRYISFICVISLIQLRDMTHSCVWHPKIEWSRIALTHGDEISPHICHELRYIYLNVSRHKFVTNSRIYIWMNHVTR